MRWLQRKLILFSYAFDNRGDHRFHEVYNESAVLSKRLEKAGVVLKMRHNSRFDFIRSLLIVIVRRLLFMKTVLIGQGLLYRRIEAFSTFRVLLITENRQTLAEELESMELSKYTKVLPLCSGSKRKWGEYFSENSIRKADFRVVYGDYSLHSYENPKTVWWQNVKEYKIFNVNLDSNNVGYILSSGYITKGLHVIVLLARSHPHFNFLIFGNVEKVLIDAIKNMKSTNIHFYGYTNFHDDKLKIDIRCFTLPYLIEGCSATALALVKSKVPLLTTRGSGIGFLLENKNIVSLNDFSDFSKLLANPEDFIQESLDLDTDIIHENLKNVISNHLH